MTYPAGSRYLLRPAPATRGAGCADLLQAAVRIRGLHLHLHLATEPVFVFVWAGSKATIILGICSPDPAFFFLRLALRPSGSLALSYRCPLYRAPAGTWRLWCVVKACNLPLKDAGPRGELWRWDGRWSGQQDKLLHGVAEPPRPRCILPFWIVLPGHMSPDLSLLAYLPVTSWDLVLRPIRQVVLVRGIKGVGQDESTVLYSPTSVQYSRIIVLHSETPWLIVCTEILRSLKTPVGGIAKHFGRFGWAASTWQNE